MIFHLKLTNSNIQLCIPRKNRNPFHKKGKASRRLERQAHLPPSFLSQAFQWLVDISSQLHH